MEVLYKQLFFISNVVSDYKERAIELVHQIILHYCFSSLIYFVGPQISNMKLYFIFAFIKSCQDLQFCIAFTLFYQAWTNPGWKDLHTWITITVVTTLAAKIPKIKTLLFFYACLLARLQNVWDFFECTQINYGGKNWFVYYPIYFNIFSF